LASPVGSGVGADLAVAVTALADATARDALGEGVALTLPGAVQDTHTIATSSRSIVGR
jgi:hypothetical protein